MTVVTESPLNQDQSRDKEKRLSERATMGEPNKVAEALAAILAALKENTALLKQLLEAVKRL